MSTSFHVAISVDIDRFSDAYMRKNYLDLFRRNGIATVEGIRQACANARAKGWDVFPPCDNVKADGSCAGHEVKP